MARKIGKSFSIDDPPDVMDPNLVDVAKYLSVHLGNDADFFKFGVQLVSDKKLDVKVIAQDTKSLPNKCLALIELWIRSVVDPKWQDVIKAASASSFDGLATALTAEFGSQRSSQKEEQEEKRAVGGGNYKDFKCSVAADTLKTQLGALTKLNYSAMMGSLYSNDVITNGQRQIIDAKIGEGKMMYLIVDILIPSLKLNHCKKYRGFLKAMEENDDSDLKSMAKKLGGSNSVPDS